jgi:hypothetical protein
MRITIVTIAYRLTRGALVAGKPTIVAEIIPKKPILVWSIHIFQVKYALVSITPRALVALYAYMKFSIWLNCEGFVRVLSGIAMPGDELQCSSGSGVVVNPNN